MAFEGDLSNLSLGDVLQTIAGARQSGTFVIRGAEERRLAVGTQGIALLSARASLGLLIGNVLAGTNKITKAQLDEALKVQRRRRDSRIGEILVEAGACSPEDVRAARTYVAAEEIYELFTWHEGKFEFIAGEPDGAGLFADIWFDVPSLAMEAARRIDEMPRALEAAPPSEVYVRVPGADARRAELDSTPDLKALLALIDGARTVTDVHEAHHRGRFDTWKGMETLLERSFLRPATLDEILDAANAAYAAKDYVRAGRLYGRASDHAPDDESIREAVSACMRGAGDKQGAAQEMVRLAAARLAARDPAAVETFRAAIAIEPGGEAYEGLTLALLECGEVEQAVETCLAATALMASLREFDGALRVVDACIEIRRDDPALFSARATALHGLGRGPEAVEALEEAARLLVEAGVRDDRLVDVYRRIVQVDPARTDYERRIEEIQTGGQTRRKRTMQRVSIAAGVLVLLCASVPFVRGPSVESRLAKVRAFVDAAPGDAAGASEAKAIIESLAGARMTDDERIDLDGLKVRVEQLVNPPDTAALKHAVDDALDAVYRAESAAIAEGRIADGLAALLAGLDQLDAADARKLQRIDDAAFKKVVAEAAHESELALAGTAAAGQKMASRVAALRDRFDANVWKHEDLEVLHELVEQSGQVIEATKGDSWSRIPDLVRTLVARTCAPKDGSDKTAVESVAVVVEGSAKLVELHDRALLRARRKELKEGYVTTYADGAQLRRQGRLEETLERYAAYLARCDEFKAAAPEALYAPVVKELFGGEMMIDQRIRTERDRVAAILKDEAEAQKAEVALDFEAAFRTCKRLVHESPDIDFSPRWQMPLRIETAPPGADVVLLDGSPDGHALGKTPLSTRCPIVGGAKFKLRVAGYADHGFVRKGAADDVSGVERVVLSKIAKWKSKPGGTTEAAPMEAPGSIVVAGRNGVIRRIDAKSGDETARFESGVLDGFAGAAVLRGDRIVVAALDGKGWVLKLDDLSPISTFEAGAVRGAPLSTTLGVIVADETAGIVRLVGDDGRAKWSTRVGKVKSDPAAAGDHVVVVTSDAEVLLLSPTTGEIARRRQLRSDSTWGAPTVHAGRLFLGNGSGDVACLDAETLAEAWTRRLDGPVRGRVCATDLRVVACTGKGAVHVLDARTGDPLSTTVVGDKPDDGACGACDLPDGGFVVATKKGVVSRFDAKGSLVWRFDAAEDMVAAPRLLDDAVVLVTKKGVVVSLEP